MILQSKRMYLSSPIENAANDDWREAATRILTTEFGIDLFDPVRDPKQQLSKALQNARAKRDFETMAKIAGGFLRKDLAKIDRCDFLAAYLPHGVPTVGTTHEIVVSYNAQKPTLIVCPQGAEWASLWFWGFVDHKYIFDSLEDLYAYLRDVEAGKHKDDDRWAYVYGLI